MCENGPAVRDGPSNLWHNFPASIRPSIHSGAGRLSEISLEVRKPRRVVEASRNEANSGSVDMRPRPPRGESWHQPQLQLTPPFSKQMPHAPPVQTLDCSKYTWLRHSHWSRNWLPLLGLNPWTMHATGQDILHAPPSGKNSVLGAAEPYLL